MGWERVLKAMESAAYSAAAPDPKSAVFPGAVLLVAQGGEIQFSHAAGVRSLEPQISPLNEQMVYDIASLTKPMVTVTLAMKAVQSGKLEIDRKVSRIIQTFNVHGKDAVTVRHLLTHSSGYPAVLPFHRHIVKAHKGDRAGILSSRGAVEMVYNEIVRGKLERPAGASAVYSDVGFILLGHILETVFGGQHLDKLAQREVFHPLQLRSTGYIDLSKIRRRGLEPVTESIAPTAYCPWRDKILCGEVHDDNAWAMGGIAAHAGVFSTALEVHSFASHMIEAFHGRSDFLNADVVRLFWTRDGQVPESTWALGWDTPSSQGSSAGKYFSGSSVGHLGFTGCSLWIDPEREIDVVLLSNRIHPSVENTKIREFRPLIHDLVMEALAA